MDTAHSESFLKLYDELAEPLFRHCYFRVSSREAAEDLVHLRVRAAHLEVEDDERGDAFGKRSFDGGAGKDGAFGPEGTQAGPQPGEQLFHADETKRDGRRAKALQRQRSGLPRRP